MGASLRRRESSWGRLGGVLEPAWKRLGASWRLLGSVLSFCGRFLWRLGSSWRRLAVLFILSRAESSKMLFSSEISMFFLVPRLHFRNGNHWKIDVDRFLGDSRMLLGSSWLALGCFCLVLVGCWALSGRT